MELDKEWNWTAPLLKGSTNSGQLITEDCVSHYDEVNMKMHSFMQDQRQSHHTSDKFRSCISIRCYLGFTGVWILGIFSQHSKRAKRFCAACNQMRSWVRRSGLSISLTLLEKPCLHSPTRPCWWKKEDWINDSTPRMHTHNHSMHSQCRYHPGQHDYKIIPQNIFFARNRSCNYYTKNSTRNFSFESL